MANLSVSSFLGMFPRRGSRLLEDNMGVLARDVRALSGYLEGRPGETPRATLASAAKRVFNATNTAGASAFITFDVPDVDIVKAPIKNDVYERYYWAGVGVLPAFNTFARIQSGLPAYRMGRPRPTTAPTLTKTSGVGTTSPETRAYVYTYVDALGQESAPSDPTLVTAVDTDDTVTVAVPAMPVDAARPAITAWRIYRTVPGVSQTSFFFVAEVAAPAVSYVDTFASSAVALNSTMECTTWFPPPDEMSGLAVMPSGFLVGFKGRDILFSEPYRPHAWPPQYVLSVEDEIVGIAVFDTNVAVLTTGTPVMVSGVVPEAMTPTKVGPVSACLSRRSIVPMAGAVLYASEDGIVSITAGAQQTVTKELIDRDTWRAAYFPDQIIAARDGDTIYVGFYSANKGFELDFADPGRGVIETTFTLGAVTSFDQDAEGRRALLTSGVDLYTYSATGAAGKPYVWTSKEFYVTKPINMGAAQMNSAPAATPQTLEAQFALIADGRVVFEETRLLDEPFKLPSSYKAQVFQMRVTGSVPISRIMLAESERELASL